MGDLKYMVLKEFKEKGYLQEVNRLFFHPLGLAIEVIKEDDGEISRISGIQDYREDPEGMVFSDLIRPECKEKAQSVEEERLRYAAIRQERFGWAVQPIGHSFPEET